MTVINAGVAAPSEEADAARDPDRPGGGLDLEQEAWARSFVAKVPWTFARTVPDHPDDYCLRAWLSREHQTAFDWSPM